MTYIPGQGGTSSVSPLVVYLSQKGITSDATGGIDYGATAASGSGQEAAINSALAAASAAGGAAGVKIVWDVAVAIGGPIYLYSNMTIEAPTPQCGAIVRQNALCPIWRMHGMETAPSSNTSTASQNSFGQIDSTAFGTTSGSTDYRYRVFNPAFVNVKNVAIIGGTWNANSLQQPAVNQSTGANQSTVPYGFISVCQFWGVDGLTIKDARFFLSNAYAMHFVNVRNVALTNVDVDQHFTGTYGDDAIHFNGPAQLIRIKNVRTHCSDDNIAFNADDGASVFSLTSGINWACSGAVTDATVEDWTIWRGRENVQGIDCLRLLSTAARIDNIRVSRVSGTISGAGVVMTLFTGSLISGSGNFGHVVLEDFTVDGAMTQAGAVLTTNSAHDCLEIRNRNRIGAYPYPDINIQSGAAIKSLVVTGEWTLTVGLNSNQPAILNAGSIDLLQMRARSYRPSGIAIGAAPFVRNSGTIGTMELDLIGVSISNLVENSGTISTANVSGIHKNAGGGSPISGTAPTILLNANLATDSGGGAPPTTLLLDGITSTVKGAWGLRKLKAAYAGSCIRVQRSSDNTQQDIGFTGNDLDTTTLLSFVGSGNGFVAKWYDQSGTGSDAAQTTAAAMPQIVNAGALITLPGGKPAVQSTSTSNTLLLAASFPISGSTFAAFGVTELTDITTPGRVISYVGPTHTFDYDNAASAAILSFDTNGGGVGQKVYIAQSNNVNSTIYGPVAANTPYQFADIWVSGVASGTVNGAAGSSVTLTPALVTGGTLGLMGFAGAGTNYSPNGLHSEFVIVQGAVATGDQASIRASQHTYYGTA